MIQKLFLVASLVAMFGCQAHYKISSREVVYVWWAGGEKRARNVAGADPQTFEQLNNTFGRDHLRAFWMGSEVKNAHATSFTPLDNYHAIDDRNAYFTVSVLTDSKAQSFELLAGSWSRDDANYYYNKWRVPVCDYDTFEIIDEYVPSRGLDRECYIFAGGFNGPQIVSVLDFGSLEILPGNYARDSQAAYYGGSIISRADPKTFEVREGTDFSIARDTRQCYAGTRPLSCEDLDATTADWCRC